MEGNQTNQSNQVDQTNQNNRKNVSKNSIVLMSGAVLDCYQKESLQVDFAPDKMKLDTTGVYLTRRNKRRKPEPIPSEEAKRLEKLFTDNAFYLLARRDRIMSDSRMFLTPVAVQSGLAYTGTSGFHNPTVGVYLEWWDACPETMRIDKKGNRSLVYYLAGSPLSGMNSCAEVYENCKIGQVQLRSFRENWSPFVHINTRYDKAKQIYQAYTLEQLLEILHSEDKANFDYSHKITESFMQSEIDSLNKRVEHLNEEASRWYKKYVDIYTKYNDTRIKDAFSDFRSFREKQNAKINSLKAQKRELKAGLKSGSIDSVAYQQKIMLLNSQIKELEFELSRMHSDLCNKFLSEGISYSEIKIRLGEDCEI